jgi:hypothetical protein
MNIHIHPSTVLLLVVLTGCRPAAPTGPDTGSPAVNAISAATDAQAATATATAALSATWTSAAVLPTDTKAAPGAASNPTATPAPGETPCYWANFIGDLSAPDGWKVGPRTAFTKTWRLGNIGRCPWTPDFQLVWDSGEQMRAPYKQPLTSKTIAPGKAVDVSVDLISPDAEGVYQGFFKIQAPDGTDFGIGTKASAAFWVKIQVVRTDTLPGITPPTIIVKQEVTVADNGFESISAACPKGTVVTGGGFSVSDPVLRVTKSMMNNNGWMAEAANDSGRTQTLTVTAVCLSLASAATEQAGANFAKGDNDPAAFSCPVGTVVTGGGFSHRITYSYRESFFIATNSRAGNGWRFGVRIPGRQTVGFSVFAVCLSGGSATPDDASASTSVAPNEEGFVEAACPAGEVLTGGGWSSSNGLIIREATVFGKTWRVAARNVGSDRAEKLESLPVCLAFH